MPMYPHQSIWVGVGWCGFEFKLHSNPPQHTWIEMDTWASKQTPKLAKLQPNQPCILCTMLQLVIATD
jgi:hypothetical protein